MVNSFGLLMSCHREAEAVAIQEAWIAASLRSSQ
jgi:hypothetical protein